MRKYLLIAIIFACPLSGFSQNANAIWIDSLKKILPSLYDSAKVDGLNELAKAFGTMGPYPAWDSIYKYAIAANKEALKIGYKKGEAFSLLNLAGSERKDLSSTEAYIKQAISIGENIKDPNILGRSYLYWSYQLKKESRIEVLRKALDYFEQSNDIEGQVEASIGLCGDYTTNGEYEEGFKYCDKCSQLIKQAALTPWGHEVVLWYFSDIADLYKRAGDYETALNYYRQGNQYAQEHQLTWNMDLQIINPFTQLGQYDSALYYWKKFENSATPYVLNHRAYWSSVLGQIYLKTKQYDKALAIAKEGIVFFKDQKSTGFSLTEHLLSAAKVYTEVKNYKTALEYAREGIKLAEKNDMLQSVMEGYQLLADVYHHLGNNTNAYFYLQKHMILKDSILNRQFFWRLNNYKKQAEEERKTSQINLLNKDNQLKGQKLKQQAFVKNGLIAGLVLLLLLGLFIFRTLTQKRKNALEKQQLENEKKQAELQQRATELEMQALRAQMNPHFIFNCLSSINKFILKNDTNTASDYLTRFSRLIRFGLANSQLSLIPLSDEIEMLRLYLDMERLRFSESFNYNIIYENTIEPETIYIPPMLLQPFCENAIWHGLMHKEGQGKLEVMMSIQNEELQCIIADNGIGREKAAELKSKTGTKQKSFGLKITTERLALFNKEKNDS
jgi:tetratricopeptide (TPR) repeat protein